MLLFHKNKIDLAVRNALFEPKVTVLKRVSQPVFLWTMGKVGSTSIAHGLARVKGVSVFTSHFMNDPEYPRSCVLYRQLIEPQISLKIISLVRDPISKNVSSFFQNYEKNTGRPYTEGDLSIDELSDLFFQKYTHHDSPLTWFDRYVKRYTKIDVYSQPFSYEYKACKLSCNNYELLVLRCDLPDGEKAAHIENFLGLASGALVMRSHNVGAAKAYSNTYAAFKEKVVFPSSYLDRMRDSRYFRHFYTAEEIDSNLAKWRRC